MVNTDPKIIEGNWVKGYALDLHTTCSEYIGDNEFGYPEFETTRSELGELIFRLKYKSDKTAIDEIVDTASDFLKNKWNILSKLDFMIAVLPSNYERIFQPVIEVARKLSSTLNLPLCEDCLYKIKNTPELKSVIEISERETILKDAFSIKGNNLIGKNVLLFDDLFRSGATIRIITEVLYNKAKVNNVYVLTLTKTRINR
jgi:predicted amidophosphoribosyltransferase